MWTPSSSCLGSDSPLWTALLWRSPVHPLCAWNSCTRLFLFLDVLLILPWLWCLLLGSLHMWIISLPSLDFDSLFQAGPPVLLPSLPQSDCDSPFGGPHPDWLWCSTLGCPAVWVPFDSVHVWCPNARPHPLCLSNPWHLNPSITPNSCPPESELWLPSQFPNLYMLILPCSLSLPSIGFRNGLGREEPFVIFNSNPSFPELIFLYPSLPLSQHLCQLLAFNLDFVHLDFDSALTNSSWFFALCNCWSLGLNSVYVNGNRSVFRENILQPSWSSIPLPACFPPSSPCPGSVPQLEL